MKGIILSLCLALFMLPARSQPDPLNTTSSPPRYAESVREPRFAVGARLGEPGGIMLRRYFKSGKNALEVNFGTYGAFWDNDRSYRNGYFKNIGFAVNALYLWHSKLGSRNTWRAYYGFGPQINKRQYYRLQTVTLQSGQTGMAETFIKNIALGGAGTAGLEYFLNRGEQPLSLFGEIGVYTELVPALLHTHIQGGAGVRFNF